MRSLSTRFLWVGFLVGFLACGQAIAAPGFDVYGSHPALRGLTISPDGQHVAMVATQGDADIVVISKIGGGLCRLGSGGSKLAGVTWANNERLIVVAVKTAEAPNSPGNDDLYDWSQAYAVNTSCADPKKMDGHFVEGFAPDGQVLMGVWTYNNATSSEKNLRRSKLTAYKLNIHKVDAGTGHGELYESGADRTSGWIVNASGEARLRIDWDGRVNQQIVYARIGTDKTWVQVYDQRGSDPDKELNFVGLAKTPDTAYVETYNANGRLALYEFDLRTRTLGRVVFQHPQVDVGGLVGGAYSQQPLGVGYTVDYPTIEYFDRDFAQMQADLNATFPGEHSYVVSVAKDRKRYIAYVEGEGNPAGVYYYVDMVQPAISPIGAKYPAIKAADIGPVKSITYAARDGTMIPAYLTLPNGSSGQRLPLVIMPHGGPEARDTARFDPWAQFLASRGYAVLQPQYRGSDGFGLAHRNAGRHQWGLLVQDDISDGVLHLIKTGVVDPARVCIVGWSFGGYAAEAGLAFSPDLYKCGVSGAGVSDLMVMLQTRGRWLGDNDYWTWVIGSTGADRDRLIATSPARHAANFKAPLLLVHGKDDTVVPKEQSDIMADAMKAAGKPYEYVVLEGEDHHLSRSATSKRFLQELERFLGKYLK